MKKILFIIVFFMSVCVMNSGEALAQGYSFMINVNKNFGGQQKDSTIMVMDSENKVLASVKLPSNGGFVEGRIPSAPADGLVYFSLQERLYSNCFQLNPGTPVTLMAPQNFKLAAPPECSQK